MFCPKCKAEYEDWVKECADCKIALVSELPPEPKKEYSEFKELLSTFNQGDVAIIKAILEKENIVYYFKGEYSTLYLPLAGPIVLMVKKDQVKKAKAIIKSYNLNYNFIAEKKKYEDK